MAYALKAKMAGDPDMSLKDMISAGVESFRTATDDGVDYDNTTDTPNTADKQIESMIKVYYHYILPKIEPVEVEVRMEAQIDDNMTLSGQPDVLELDAVRDLKTGRSGEKYHAQLGGYILLAKANKKPVNIQTAVIDWLPRARLSKPQPEPVELEYSAELCVNEAKAVIKDVQRQYGGYTETGNPSSFPNNTSSMICTPKYCPAYGTDWCPVSKTLSK
jgi:phosphorylcholine metabolism protein LicD